MACPEPAEGSPNVMEPVSGSWSVAIVRISVDLPAPFGPRRPYIPRGMSRVTSRRARTPLGYVLLTPRIARSILRGERVRLWAVGPGTAEHTASPPIGFYNADATSRRM